MATMWKRAMLYLGLGPDEEYDDDGDDDEPRPARQAPADASESRGGAVRPLPRERAASPEPATAAVATSAGAASRRSGVVRPLPPPPAGSRPFAVAPGSFNDAQQVADRFLASTPVIMNLEGVDRDLARRLVDFASGLCYGTRGSMEKVTTSVYLLTPSNVEVSAEDRRRLQHGGG